MKNSLLIANLFLLFSMSSFAQTNILLNIHHKLGNIDFAMETGANNNLGNDFEVTRLQYYISEITIVHDGSMETVFDNVWVLANASEATQVDLGDSNINSVEMVKLHVGVDSDHNHLDPSSYQGSHPLAPKFPSMHWGWDPGYRFVAFEGNGGNNLDQLFQLHGLGDDNYFVTEIPLIAEVQSNEIIINVDADYTRALEDINVNSGVIVHGSYAQAQQCLENFRDFVFTASNSVTATVDVSEVSKFDVYPNPTNGNATIILEGTQDLNYDVLVTDILGKEIMFFDAVRSNTSIDLELNNPGFYFVNLIKEGQVALVKKLMSK